MMLGLELLVVYVTTLHYSQTTDAAIIVRPSDTAVKVGSNASFYCKVSTSTDKIWWTWTGNGTYQNLAPSCQVITDYRSRFKVDKSERGACNLIVISASLADAADYTCVDRTRNGTAPQKTAQLVVLDRVVGAVNVTENSIAEGTVLQYTCSVQFNGTLSSDVVMSASWKPEPPHFVNSRGSHYVLSSIAKVTAHPPHVPPYTCTIHFKGNGTNYTAQFTFTTYRVVPINGSDDSSTTTSDDNSTATTSTVADLGPSEKTFTCSLSCIIAIVVVVVCVVIIAIIVIIIICCCWSKCPCYQRYRTPTKSKIYQGPKENDGKLSNGRPTSNGNANLEQRNSVQTQDEENSHELQPVAADKPNEADPEGIIYSDMEAKKNQAGGTTGSESETTYAAIKSA